MSFVFPSLEQLRAQMGLLPKDEQLLRMIFAPCVTCEEKRTFFSKLEIETEPMEFNLMLAQLAFRHGHDGIPPAILPRIQGVARHYLFKNGALFSSFRSLHKKLNEAGFSILLLKGAAMKACFDPKSSRCLVDVDFAVSKKCLREVVKIAERQGFQIVNRTLHSIDMKNQQGLSIDIHDCLFKTSYQRSFEDELLEGAKQILFFGVEAWVSSAENLLLQIVENEFYNLSTVTKQRRRFKWIYDCGALLAAYKQIDWGRVVNNAHKYSISEPILSMLCLLNEYLPDDVPKAVLEDLFSLSCKEPMSEMKQLVMANLEWCSKGARRERFKSSGKKWRSFFLWPSQMQAKYRFFKRLRKGTL